MKWDEARDSCKNKGGFLALVKNDETQHFLRDNLVIGEGLWIGGKAGRHWKWSSDSSACSGKYLNTHIHRVLYRGDCYQFFDDSSKWDVGRTYCEDMGGYLAEILDRSAQDFISDEVRIVFGDGKQWWIGGHEDSPEEPRSWFWVDSLPSCGDPGEPLHGSRTPSDTSTFLDGATIEYQCYLGYEVKGSTSATCMLNGRWDTERPVCKAVMCPNNTSEVDNVANVTVTSEEYRGVAVYTCSPGYLPDASPVSYCQADGTWSNPNFTCMSLPPCYVEPCYNGATCSNHNSTFTCECAGGFTGLRCDTAMTTPPTEPETNPLSTSSKPDTVSFTSPSTAAGKYQIGTCS
ncbi:CUB and sushi domain-containing protein 2-like [Strongylocentrotus purpuratus]|uniref:Uncharacterized protein n=1 Tax=Strongylocentrotus purpuratus TaxID=7668 RepID=A0A7M7NEH7_STRPU|nr:CUB and sushi domain-containing protein 2-like [Strongylocentrotus purpuratus]